MWNQTSRVLSIPTPAPDARQLTNPESTGRKRKGIRMSDMKVKTSFLAGAALIAALLFVLDANPFTAAGSPDDPPERPTGLTATVEHDQVALTWDDPGDDSITGYQILRRNKAVDDPGVFHVLVNDTDSAATSHTDADVEAETFYVYRIKARNAAGLSSRSSYFNARTPAPQPPARPTGLTGTAAHDRVALTWDDSGDDSITGYQVLRRNKAVDDPGVFHVLVNDTGSTDTSYTDASVAAGGFYVFRVKARNAFGLSPRSSYFNADTPAAPPTPTPEPAPKAPLAGQQRLAPDADGKAEDSLPPALEAPTVHDDGLDALTVTWTEPGTRDPATIGYDLEYRRRDHTDWLTGPQGQTGTSATIADLEPDKNYYVRVRARNSNGAGEWSETGEGTTALYVGTMTVGDAVNYRGYRRFKGEPYGGLNSLGNLLPRSLTYDGAEYQFITMAWCICVRSGAGGLHTTAIDLYSLFHEVPDEWVLRVGDMRLALADAHRADLGSYGLKAYWPHISPGWEIGSRHEVSFSRDPLLSSSGSGVIRGPLTAETRGLPRAHDGTSAFQFTLSFSEYVKNRRDDIMGDVLTVGGGTISDASQVRAPSHREWRITIRPDGDGPVSITLAGDRDCETPGAVCTEDGRRLSRTITSTVAGPD